MKNNQLRADLMLLLVTLCWGISYYMMDLCLAEMGPFTLNAYRFLGAFAVAAIFGFKKIKNLNKTTIYYSVLIGVALYFTYIGATYGVMFTSLSNVGFLCALSVVICPILNFIFRKIVPDKKLGIVVVMCTIGIALLSLGDDFKLASGDILCILAATAYAVQIILMEVGVNKEEVDAFTIGVSQLLVCGSLCLITALIAETPAVPQTGKVWISVIFLSLFCTGLAFIVQAIAQQYTTAARVAVIYTLEPVFAGIVAFLLAGEILTPKAYLGAAILIVSMFILELDIKSLREKKNKVKS